MEEVLHLKNKKKQERYRLWKTFFLLLSALTVTTRMLSSLANYRIVQKVSCKLLSISLPNIDRFSKLSYVGISDYRKLFTKCAGENNLSISHYLTKTYAVYFFQPPCRLTCYSTNG